MIRNLLIICSLLFSVSAFADRQGGGGWLETFRSMPSAVFLAGESSDGGEVIVDALDPISGIVSRDKLQLSDIRPDYLEALQRSAKSRNWEYLRQ